MFETSLKMGDRDITLLFITHIKSQHAYRADVYYTARLRSSFFVVSVFMISRRSVTACLFASTKLLMNHEIHAKRQARTRKSNQERKKIHRFSLPVSEFFLPGRSSIWHASYGQLNILKYYDASRIRQAGKR